MRRVSGSYRLARLCFVTCLLILVLPPLAAQDTGQVCVRCFADRDRDGLRDADEAAIAHGVGASLHDRADLTIAARLLEDSPFAADGLLCFDDLPAGDYRLRLTSAEFASTTAASFTASVSPGRAPPLLEFGVAPLFAETTSRGRAPIALDADAIKALTQVLAVGLIVVALVAACGLTVAIFLFRRRSQRMVRRHRDGSSVERPPRVADDETDAPGKPD